MKNLTLFLFLLFTTSITSTFAGPVTLTNGQHLEINFSLPPSKMIPLSAEQENLVAENLTLPLQDFYQIKVPGLSLTQEPFAPSVPFYSILLVGRPGDFLGKAEKGPGETYSPFYPAPAVEKPCRCDHQNHIPAISRKETLLKGYEGQSGDSPLFKFEFLGDFRGVPLTRLLIFPQNQAPSKGAFTLYRRLKVILSRPDGKNVETYPSLSQALVEILLKAEAGRKILVLTPDRWLKVISPWVEWKRQNGFTVDVATLEKTGGQIEEIQSFLHRRYRNLKTRFQYVLLVGHEGIIPTFYLPTANHEETPSDLKYFTMGGEDDILPDVFYGRWAADSEEDLKVALAKTLAYEKGPLHLKEALTRGIGIASNEGENPTDVEYLKDMEKPFIENQKMTFQNFFQDDPESIPENINRQLSRGVIWLNYIGHGSGQSWDSLHAQSYSTHDLKSLEATPTFPVVIDVSCQNGRFLYDGRLGERFLHESGPSGPLGAVAYYGGSVDISWDPPAIMAKGISRNYFSYDLTRLGETLFAGQMSLFEHYSDFSAIKDNLTWYHLLGDPTLMIRSGTMKQLTVSIHHSTLKVEDPEGLPLPGTEVTFYEKGKYLTLKTDLAGKIKIPGKFRRPSFSILKKGYFHRKGTLR